MIAAGARTVRYGFLGTGAITRAMVTGLSDGVRAAPGILLSPRNERVASALADRFPGVRVAADNQAVVDQAEIVVLACRPDAAPAVLARLGFATDQALVSVVAGLSTAELGTLAAPLTAVARAIPLPSSAVRQGLVPVFPPLPAALDLFGRLGEVIAVGDEQAFDAFSAASAFAASQLDLLATVEAWMVGRGVAAPDARRYVTVLVDGLTAAMTTDGRELALLAEEHATPGGLNEQVRVFLRAAGVHELVGTALDDVATRVAGGPARRLGPSV